MKKINPQDISFDGYNSNNFKRIIVYRYSIAKAMLTFLNYPNAKYISPDFDIIYDDFTDYYAIDFKKIVMPFKYLISGNDTNSIQVTFKGSNDRYFKFTINDNIWLFGVDKIIYCAQTDRPRLDYALDYDGLYIKLQKGPKK